MTSFWRNPVTVVWLLLATGTATSWWLGSSTGGTTQAQRALTSGGLLVLAAVKVRLIIFYFMEVRSAPLGLRLICDAWVTAVACGLLITFWLTAAR
jgi:Prokaryotic Cytochrome C oxidase subunit IV